MTEHAERRALIGRRVRLDYTDDPHTDLHPGDEGVVTYVDDMGTIFVDWDSGSKLGLIIIEGGDRFEILD